MQGLSDQEHQLRDKEYKLNFIANKHNFTFKDLDEASVLETKN
jgi:hypothetical protein